MISPYERGAELGWSNRVSPLGVVIPLVVQTCDRGSKCRTSSTTFGRGLIRGGHFQTSSSSVTPHLTPTFATQYSTHPLSLSYDSTSMSPRSI